MDPGAVPGTSTIFKHLFLHVFYGGESGSTCVIKIEFLLGLVRVTEPLIIDANDNFAPEARMAA